jgi:RNA polymerase sigma factor (sigma-70 family)
MFEMLEIESNHIVSENDLIRGCIAKNRKMQELMYRRYSPKMFALCLRYSSNTDDAQDLLQDGFVKVFKYLDKYRFDGSFEGWMRKIFVNTSIAYIRRTVPVVPVTSEESGIENDDCNALDNFAERDIVRMIQQLSPGYRQVFNMHVIEGYSHKEIGEAMGIGEGTSKSQLARAKRALKEWVELQNLKG